MTKEINGAEIVIEALKEQGVDVIFGYPGGAVLPLYDQLFQESNIRHILVRHEQCAVHAAQGYSRVTGKPGVVLVTSGPGATNTVTGLADAMMDSTPIICISGQVFSYLIGNDAFQEADIVGITRPCTKHSYLIKNTETLSKSIHEAFHVASSGRPGPVLVDIPKDVQLQMSSYSPARNFNFRYDPKVKGDQNQIREAVDLLINAKKPIFYTGGGVINSGHKASQLLIELVTKSNAPITSTLMGLGAYGASGDNWLGMLGMHGTYEANMAMHDCDVMVCVGARFDDRITGRIDGFSPQSKKIHIDIDPSSINKNIRADIGIIGDVGHVLEDMLRVWNSKVSSSKQADISSWWQQIEKWRSRNCLNYNKLEDKIMPQYAIQRLMEISKGRDRIITTEVGQHQMWAAQYCNFEAPNKWVTSGGLGTMGFGFPAAIGAQIAFPNSLVIDIAGEASIQMTLQEIATAMQYRLPVKIFILNNRFMGMVRQWQQLFHDSRYSQSYSETLPDFVKVAEAYGGVGLRATKPDELDDVIKTMINTDNFVIVDCVVHKIANCFPMIPANAAHNEMMLADENSDKDVEVVAR